MRKRLKIKAFTLIFSWMIIFLHGVVPHLHNHGSLPVQTNHKPGHSCTAEQINIENENNYSYFIAGVDHKHSNEVCHFNPNLFSNINIDNTFIYVESNKVSFEEEVPVISRPDVRPQLKKPPLLTTKELRAPPAA